MPSAPFRISPFASILMIACALQAGAQDKPGPDDRAVLEQNRAIRQRVEEEHRREASRYAAAQDMIRLRADSNACLASHRQNGTCLLTIGEFNRFAVAVEPEGEMSEARIREARKAMLKELLRAAYLAERLNEAGLGDKVVEAGKAEEKKVWEEAAKDAGLPRIRALYARYREFFAAREERLYEVLASTDSALVDSLHRLASRASSGGPAAGPADRIALPWARLPDSLLPASLSQAGRKLRKWRCSPPLRWESGWAVLRPAEVNKIPAIPFEDALPGLVGLAGYASPDSSQAAAEALEYFRAHPREFAAPDSLLLEARLDPGAEGDSGVLRPAAPRTLPVAALPVDARHWLRNRGELRAGMSLGPVRMGMGWWAFRVLEAKPGKGARTFAQVRDSLAERFVRAHARNFMAQRAETLNRKRRDRGMRIFEEMLDERNPPTAEEISRAIAADSVGLRIPSDIPEDKRRDLQERLAAARVRDNKRDESFSEWLGRSVKLSGI